MDGQSRILVIDDDESIRTVLTMLLEDEGYFVESAKSGKEGVEKSNNGFYNLAIVDWRLPDIEGTKLLGKLRDTTPKMVKIMLTGFPSMQNAIDSVNSSADAFILKPVSAEALLNKVKELLLKQEENKKFNEEKVAGFLETRVRELKVNISSVKSPAEMVTELHV
jgi:DNA-binding NtrC family response regulator